MKHMTQVFLIVTLTLLPLAAFAGNLDSPGDPTSTAGHMPTLEELYNYLTSGTEPGAVQSFQEPASGPEATMKTLQELYDDFKALIDAATVTPEKVLNGQTFFSTTGIWGPADGTMPDRGAVTITPGTSAQGIALGYHNGSGHVQGDADLTPENIVAGATIFGVSGTATIMASEPNLKPENIKCGVTIYGVTGGSCVAQTGQTSCSNVSGNSISCANTGQDGEYQMGCSPVVAPSGGDSFDGYNRTSLNACAGEEFTDNEDGTVTDNWTGLIWLKNANCFGVRNWTGALSAANNLAHGGCGLTDGSSAGDWRLPNINELRSLLDPGQSATQYLPTSHPFTDVQSDEYWSSTSVNRERRRAWFVALHVGGVYSVYKTFEYGDHRFSVWPVRGGRK